MDKKFEAVIVDAVRSPLENKKGNLQHLQPPILMAQVIGHLKERNNNGSKAVLNIVEDVAIGCAFPEASQGLNIARQASVLNFPFSVPAVTINRFCGSSAQAILNIAQAINAGYINCGVAGGVENMFQIPMTGFNPCILKKLEKLGIYMGMGDTAENLAREGNISRNEQEEFAIHSHLKALKAQAEGWFDNEIVPITLNNGTICDKDNAPMKPNPEKIKALPPIFDKISGKGTVTAATSSPLSVGASALLIMSRENAEKYGYQVRAVIKGGAVTGCNPSVMGKGPIKAVAKALLKTNLSLKQIQVIELNEAFASQSVFCIKETGWNPNIINMHGGAIALGHPLGASGARIITTLLNVMERNEFKLGLATMCIGGGQGICVVLEIK